jgi:hypothetical protein
VSGSERKQWESGRVGEWEKVNAHYDIGKREVTMFY